jgi:glycosyltransferase involved in cell wall biosynthesis
MKHRLVILTEIISPYRIPLFNALAQREDVDPHVIFLAETDPQLRGWNVYKEEIRFSYQVLPSWRRRIGKYNLLLNSGTSRALRRTSPDSVLCGGYNYLASWEALLWAKLHKIPFFLWSESNLQDIRGGRAAVELLKGEFLRRCTGFVVPGRSAAEYFSSRSIKTEAIFTAPNAVDNTLFADAAAAARKNAASCRTALSLPDRYFLFVGRLVREKGVFELLSAYATLDPRTRLQIGLVFAGDGVSRRRLEEKATSISPGAIRFTGFVQREQIASLYALAEMLILPTYTDPWGLVVNEAMACSLPVILSQAAGCAADLVTEGWNGRIVSPRDVKSLASAMQEIASSPDLSVAMGANSAKRIAAYSPPEWAKGIGCVTESVGAKSGQATN